MEKSVCPFPTGAANVDDVLNLADVLKLKTEQKCGKITGLITDNPSVLHTYLLTKMDTFSLPLFSCISRLLVIVFSVMNVGLNWNSPDLSFKNFNQC